MPNAFQNIDILSLSAGEIILNLTVALLCGLSVAQFYRMSQNQTSNGHSFIQSLVLLALITSMVIMIIGDSLARAFGLVGAMSIIRFRTAVKDTSDILYIFFALGAGLAAGAGAYRIALIGTVGIGGVSFLLNKYLPGGEGHREYVLQFQDTMSATESAYKNILLQNSKSYSIVQMKEAGAEGMSITCSVRFARKQNPAALVEALKSERGIQNVSFFFDDRQY